MAMTDSQIHYRKNREYYISAAKARYSKRKTLGICTVCGKEQAEAGKCKCRACRLRINAQVRAKQAKKKVSVEQIGIY